MRLRRAILSTVATVSVCTAWALPSRASAAILWGGCSSSATFQCASVDVPLDRTGEIPTTLSLAVARLPAAQPSTTAIVALAGGPGQSALPIASSFARDLKDGLGNRDLLIFDQRGTGLSNPLTCPAAQTARSEDEFVATCAQQLGPARARFTTVDSAADIESIRAAGGYDKLILYGVSYGTKVAMAYAATYPTRTAGLILDSVVTPEGPDALRRSSLKAVPRILQELCAGDVCKGVTADPAADVRKLAAKLVKRQLKGAVFDGRGRRYVARLSEAGLMGVLVAGDLNPALRAELPGSVRAALTGDTKPILRLSAQSAGLENRRGYQEAAADNNILFFTTVCEENTTIPWTRGAPLAQRVAEVTAAAKALPAEQLGVFDYRAALAGIPSICAPYPVAGPGPDPSPPLPAVPTLLLEGRADLRTPLEDSEGLLGRIGGAQLITVPHTGHSVLGSDFGTCSAAAMTAFFSGQPPAACPEEANEFPPTPKPPLSLSRTPLYRGTTGKAGRTIEAARRAVNDARRQITGAILALGGLPRGVGGLRGGYANPTGKGTAFNLHNYQYVSGVAVSGSIPNSGAAKLRITGSKAARGSLRVVLATGAVTGTLGGRRVKANLSARAAAARPTWRSRGLPSLREALRRGRLIAASR